MPTSQEILHHLQNQGIVVGSFIDFGEAAKDIDVVIDEHRDYGSHPIFNKMRQLYPDAIASNSCGHMAILASPQIVEIFESNIFLINKNASGPTPNYEELAANITGKLPVHGVQMMYWKQSKGQNAAYNN